MPALDDTLLGTNLDEYRVERALGKGGMARVYLALDTRLQRYVALKVISPDLRSDKEYAWRFEREAQSIARLDHPNIVHIYRFGAVGDLYYMAMQYIDGADVERIVEDYRLDGELMALPDIARIIQEIGAALDYAHSRSVIHRDIKPSNIMLDKAGRAVLTDFGLALLGDLGTRGEVFGSPHYIAPEQAISSGNVVPQSDLYALGVVLFYMLTGDVPFRGDDPMDVALRHVSEAPPPPSALNPALSAEIDAVVLRCLAKEPRDRFQTGAELSTALNAALSTSPAPAEAPPGPLRYSLLHVSAKVQQTQDELPPLPELETIPPPSPDEPLTQPVGFVRADRTLMRNPPQSAAEPAPTPPAGVQLAEAQPSSAQEIGMQLVGALRRVPPRFWIAGSLALGALLVVALCGLAVLTLLSRPDGGRGIASAPETPTPALTPTLTPSATPTVAPSPTRTSVPTPTPLVLGGPVQPPGAFPTALPPVFPTAPGALPPGPISPGLLPPDRSVAPPGSRRLGEFAVEWYCNERGLGVTLFNGDVDWACTNPDGSIGFILQPTDFDAICRRWYTNENAFAIRDMRNPTQAYNWSCYEFAAQNVTGLATPSVTTLRIDATRDWVAFTNVSSTPLTLASFTLEREGRRIDGSAWGRTVLNPGECLMIHKGERPPRQLPQNCSVPISLPGRRGDREFWLKGEVFVFVNPDVQYRYSPDEAG